MSKTLNNLLEFIAGIILIPLVVVFKLSVFLLIVILLTSPLILLGWIVWLIAS